MKEMKCWNIKSYANGNANEKSYCITRRYMKYETRNIKKWLVYKTITTNQVPASFLLQRLILHSKPISHPSILNWGEKIN